MSREIYWHARAEGIAYMGPYTSQVQAWDAVCGSSIARVRSLRFVNAPDDKR